MVVSFASDWVGVVDELFMPNNVAAIVRKSEGAFAGESANRRSANDEFADGACNGPCAENWPVLLASDSDKASGDWSIVARDDGKKMWAYKGRPLYTWKSDKAPGDTDGDGKLNGAWHIAAP